MIRRFLSDLLGAACIFALLWFALVATPENRLAASPDAATHE